MKISKQVLKAMGTTMVFGLLFMGVTPETFAQAKFKIEKSVEVESDGNTTSEEGFLIVKKKENGKETEYKKNLKEIKNEEAYLESLGVDLNKLKKATKKIEKNKSLSGEKGVTKDVDIR